MVLGRWGGNASAIEDRDEAIPSPEPLQLHLPKYGVEFRKELYICNIHTLYMWIY